MPCFASHASLRTTRNQRPGGVIIHQAKQEALTVSRFTLVGIAATCVHVCIVWALITQFEIEVLLANLVAFMTAFLVSFSGQYAWTFRSSRKWHSALLRFSIISLFAFGLNNIALMTLLGLEFIPDSHAAILAVCIIPVITYLAGRFWAFS